MGVWVYLGTGIRGRDLGAYQCVCVCVCQQGGSPPVLSLWIHLISYQSDRLGGGTVKMCTCKKMQWFNIWCGKCTRIVAMMAHRSASYVHRVCSGAEGWRFMAGPYLSRSTIMVCIRDCLCLLAVLESHLASGVDMCPV